MRIENFELDSAPPRDPENYILPFIYLARHAVELLLKSMELGPLIARLLREVEPLTYTSDVLEEMIENRYYEDREYATYADY